MNGATNGGAAVDIQSTVEVDDGVWSVTWAVNDAGDIGPSVSTLVEVAYRGRDMFGAVYEGDVLGARCTWPADFAIQAVSDAACAAQAQAADDARAS